MILQSKMAFTYPEEAVASSVRSVQGSVSRTYTVKAGDTLSKIANEHYGDPNQYNKIFEANRDKLTDPNKIRPGQVLVIP